MSCNDNLIKKKRNYSKIHQSLPDTSFYEGFYACFYVAVAFLKLSNMKP